MLIRSKLFVPGSRPELFARSARSAADAVSFDLKDSVAPDCKSRGRASVVAFLRARLGEIVIVDARAVAAFAESPARETDAL